MNFRANVFTDQYSIYVYLYTIRKPYHCMRKLSCDKIYEWFWTLPELIVDVSFDVQYIP